MPSSGSSNDHENILIPKMSMLGYDVCWGWWQKEIFFILKSTCFSHSIGSQARQTQWCKEKIERACHLFDLISMIGSAPSFHHVQCYRQHLLSFSNPNSSLLPGNHNLLFFEKTSTPSAKLSNHKPLSPSPLANYPLAFLLFQPWW